MTALSAYYAHTSAALQSEFDRTRAVLTDSASKGGANERRVAEFLRLNWAHGRPSLNKQIIDSEGATSGEIDVTVCNRFQPFSPEDSDFLIAEGVDFVVQVKAILTADEIERIRKNCATVKNLNRKVHKDTTVWALMADTPHYVQRIPYAVFSFDSKLSVEKAVTTFREVFSTSAAETQPDIICMLNQGIVVNCREGQGLTRHNLETGQKFISWFGLEAGEHSLLEFMNHIYSIVPFITHSKHPFTFYGPQASHFKVYGSIAM